MLCDREALRWKLTWVRVIREGFLEEWVPEPIPGEEQAVDKWVGKWRAFGRGDKVQGAWRRDGTHMLMWVPCYRWQWCGRGLPTTLLGYNKKGVGGSAPSLLGEGGLLSGTN